MIETHEAADPKALNFGDKQLALSDSVHEHRAADKPKCGSVLVSDLLTPVKIALRRWTHMQRRYDHVYAKHRSGGRSIRCVRMEGMTPTALMLCVAAGPLAAGYYSAGARAQGMRRRSMRWVQGPRLDGGKAEMTSSAMFRFLQVHPEQGSGLNR